MFDELFDKLVDEFNANTSKYIKLMNENGKHNSMVLHPGLNVDPIPFYTEKECSPGGIYFTKEDYLWKWYNNNHTYVCDVFIPENARVHTETNHKIKADQVILGEFITLSDYVNQLTSEAQLTAVQQHGRVVQFIKSPSEEVQLAAVQQYVYAIQFIKSPSEEVQLAAVRQTGRALYWIESPSEEVQLVAVQQDGHAIQFIKSPSEEIQLAAVQQDWRALHWIKSPTEGVQLTADRQNRHAIKSQPKMRS